jgi:SAM-dependent methyltransferase
MIRYVLAAVALKSFSLNGASKRLYRWTGNTIGSRRRAANIDIAAYISRGDLLVDLCNKYFAVRDGQRLLEIGTGWMHWFAIYLRLFVDGEIATMDVWDNRQFGALRAAFTKFETALVARGASPHACANLRSLLAATSFADVYDRLKLSYVISPDGSLAMFADGSRDCVFSFHVLEHVPRAKVARLCVDMHRVLKPGGFAIHQIGIDDHLAHYDRSCSPKEYLRYSDRTWKWFFENEVQYVNRIQMSEWLLAFGSAGFSVRETLAETVDISGLRIAPMYRSYSDKDLACTILTVVLQKPVSIAQPASQGQPHDGREAKHGL